MEDEFSYNGKSLVIQCNRYDTIGQIFQKFSIKSGININSVTFIYNGDGNINRNLIIDQVANNIDKNRNKMNILVYDMNKSISISSNSTTDTDTQKLYINSYPQYQIYPHSYCLPTINQNHIPIITYQNPNNTNNVINYQNPNNINKTNNVINFQFPNNNINSFNNQFQTENNNSNSIPNYNINLQI